MIKKLLLSAFLSVNCMYAQSLSNTKYIQEDKMDYINFRPFVGVEAGISYIDTTHGLDKSMLGYGLYVGMPVSSWEVIAKIKKDTTRNLHVISKALSVNMPLYGSGTDFTYVGLVGGKNELRWRNHNVTSMNIQDDVLSTTFYGIHLGQKFKFTRNFYVRIELEYAKYDYISKTNSNDIGADDGIEFNYGFEYKF